MAAKNSPLLLAALALLLSFAAAGADDFNAFVYAGCSRAHYYASSQYSLDVGSVLTSLSNAAAAASYANFTSNDVVGLFQCRSDVQAAPLCAACVRSAISKASGMCSFAAGAAVQLRGCLVRYGNDSFVGKPDTSLLLKKCGDAPSFGVDGAGMRDAALNALLAAGDGGAYRAGGAGSVKAMSQCVGDIGAKQCSECVAAAAAQLKGECGYADDGEVYLGKCYARFWNEGNGVTGAGGEGGGGSTGGPGGFGPYAYGYAPRAVDHGTDTGKTLAIIIGLFAGIALLIVFLSFIRRTDSEYAGKS